MGGDAELSGPDLTQGVAEQDVPEGGVLVGHAHGEPVLLARRGADVFAVGAKCTHYGGPLGEGLVVGDEIRCPWHHACFSLRTGAAVRAPALEPVACFDVATRNGKLVVLGKRGPLTAKLPGGGPASVVIVGAGAAGHACAEALRRSGYARPVSIYGAEATTVVDRPNLSKDYLAGTAPEEWMRVRDEDFYARQGIELHLGARRFTRIDVVAKQVHVQGAEPREYDALVLATGAQPGRLAVPGSDLPGTSSRCARCPTARRSSRAASGGRSERWSSALASSGSRWRPACRRTRGPSTRARRRKGERAPLMHVLGESAPAPSSAASTRPTVSRSTSRTRRRPSTRARSRSRAARGWRRTSS